MSKTVMVTGGAQRLGREICLAFADWGYDVVIHYNSSQEAAESLAELISGRGQTAYTVQADLSDPASLSDMAEVFHAFPVSVLVHNASVFPEGSFQDLSIDDLQTALQLHLVAPLLLTQYFSRFDQAEQVICLTDCMVHEARDGRVAYDVSKKALQESVAIMATSLAPKIRVNGIAPGWILDPIGTKLSPKQKKARLAQVPLLKQGDVSDILSAIHYLLDASFVTGETLSVSGGRGIL